MSDVTRPIPLAAGRGLFGFDPAGYDTARPPYPSRVLEVLRDRGGITASARVLEIGPATGLATRLVASLGVAHIVAVEPDGALAEYLRATWDQATTIDVVVQPFEEIDLPDASFDLALAATSFHWIDPAVGLTKVRRVLRPGGLWAMFWNVFGDPSRADPFHEATRELLEPLEASPSGRMDLRDSPLNVEPYMQQLADASFQEIETELIPGTLELDSAGVRGLYGTYSAINRLDVDRRNRVLDELARIAVEEFDDRVVRNLVTAVYTARRGE